jgi:hypothetical protein
VTYPRGRACFALVSGKRNGNDDYDPAVASALIQGYRHAGGEFALHMTTPPVEMPSFEPGAAQPLLDAQNDVCPGGSQPGDAAAPATMTAAGTRLLG